MEHIEKIIIGIFLFVVTSVLAYLFKMRQLYAATPKLYKSTQISKDGSLCELIIYNKGNQTEEDISASLDPDLKAELLASSSSELTFESSQVKISRLHKGQEVSAVLLIENGVLDSSKVTSLTSKGTIGHVFKKTEEVPPNFALAFVLIMLFVCLVPGFWYGAKLYERLSDAYYEYKLSSVYELGWSDLQRYQGSDLQKSYSDQEFPVRFLQEAQSDEAASLPFEIYNKTAVPLQVTIDKATRAKSDLRYFESMVIPPMSKKRFYAKAPASDDDYPDRVYEFSIHYGSEFIYGLTYTYSNNK